MDETKKQYILALDQGTTSSRAIIFDNLHNVICTAKKEFTQHYPCPGWVEHDPEEIFSSQYSVMMQAIADSGISASQICAIGITNQRETTIVWDKNTGKPIYNAIVWQCRRTADDCDVLINEGWSEYVRSKTGLVIDAYFSATKIKWILDHVEGAKDAAGRGDLLFGTVDTWLIWKLTNGRQHKTDYTNASRTMLFDIRALKWDKQLLERLNIPQSMLPEVCASSGFFGYCNINGTEIPISGVAGDQQAALFGQCCFKEGDLKTTFGTGCFLLMNTGDMIPESSCGLLATIAIGIRGKVTYALEGSVFTGGAVIQWLRDEMRMLTDSRDAEYFAQTAENTDGVYLVPAFTGLGAPYWDMYARGAILGITRGTKAAHIIRAAEEAIAYQCTDLIDAMQKDIKLDINTIKVDGGASRDAFLLQFLADITGKKVIRPIGLETTALGAAYLAGLSVGVWENKEQLIQLWKSDKEFHPLMENGKRQFLLEGWHKAVNRSLGWSR